MNSKIAEAIRTTGLCILAFPLSITCFISPIQASQDKQSIYAGVPSLVVQLVRFRQNEERQCREPVGTGFFIQTTKKSGNLYLVTAGHVVTQDEDLYARVPLVKTQTGKKQMLGLHLKRPDWISHPNKGTDKILPTDVAIISLAKLNGLSGAAFTHCGGDCTGGAYNWRTIQSHQKT
jgi:hypothetical protein